MKLRFGSNELDGASRRIWHSGREVHLSTKAFDLLVLLVERRPAAVPKSEIKDRLWPGTFVSDTNLPTLIAEIRHALDDDARRGECIRTVHGFGYAFSAEIVSAPEAASDRAAAWLVGVASRIRLAAGENILGRDGDDVIALQSPTVSRRHARVIVSGADATIEDLGSKNGTYVNEARVETPAAVVDGDRVRVGSLVFTIRFGQAGTSTQTM
jgi:DNA-binding winged helix-turn-helix (wHTH) protein